MEKRYVQSYQMKVDPERFRLVDNQTTASPEMSDAIQPQTGMISCAEKRIAKTYATLGIGLSIQVMGQR
jgi:hypothetical protein